MNVNDGELSQKEFKFLSDSCEEQEGWKCKETGYACKDFLCSKVKSAENIEEVRKNFK